MITITSQLKNPEDYEGMSPDEIKRAVYAEIKRDAEQNLHLVYAEDEIWRRYKGSIPPGIVARHTCDNVWCINPRHIISGTVADNNRDKMERRRSCWGELRSNAKLNNDAVRLIRSRPDEPERALAREFGVSNTTVRRVRQRRIWKYVEDQP